MSQRGEKKAGKTEGARRMMLNEGSRKLETRNFWKSNERSEGDEGGDRTGGSTWTDNWRKESTDGDRRSVRRQSSVGDMSVDLAFAGTVAEYDTRRIGGENTVPDGLHDVLTWRVRVDLLVD